MGDVKGFLKHQRENTRYREAEERLQDRALSLIHI